MKNFYYTLLAFLFFNAVNAQIVNIPDANFKAKLLAASPSNTIAKNSSQTNIKIDINNDNEIQINEALRVTYLDVTYSNITSMEGVQSFTSIHGLWCGNNLITNIDLTTLRNMQYFDCSYNQLTTLNFNNQTYYGPINIGCHHNQLISIYLKNGALNVNSINFSNNPNLQYICTDDWQIGDIQNRIGYFGITNCHVNSYCSFTPGGTFYTINSLNKYDINNNDCDVLDNPFPNFKLNISNGSVLGSIISNTTGNYSIPVQSGTHTITPSFENPTYFIASPTTTTVTFPAATSPYTQNFCVTANGVHPDLEVNILPINAARPGFDATYKMVYKNKGTTTQSGSVNLNFDDAVLDFVSATPTVGTQTVNNLNWSFTNLLPFESRSILVTLNLNSPMETPPLSSGSVLAYNATITSPATDDTPADNVFAFNQTVVNSYDPNDKTCLEGTSITPAKVGDFVHYMIRFENNGTAAAQNIVVKDMIDTAKYDIASLIPIDGSHSFTTKISNTNQVEFIFQNINLPFDNANNDGFVAFKIKTKSTLVLGNSFSNSANIYFDYNFPIITNTYTTTIAALANQDFDFGKYFSLYPNPAKHILNIDVKNDIEVSSISIYNMLGQVVLITTNPTKTIDVSGLKTGNYFVTITTDKGISNSRFVKE